MKKVSKILCLGTVVIPLGLASVLGILLIIGVQLFHNSSFYFLPSLNTKYLLLAFIYVFIVVLIGIAITKIKHTIISITAVFVIALLPRVLLLYIFKQQLYPFSDFLWSWDVALGAREGPSYINHLPFPAYQVWAYFEFLLTKILPRTYMTVLLANAVIDSLIAVCIAKTTHIITNNERTSIVAGVLYALFLPSVFYCTIGTPEHLAIFFNLMGIILLIKCHRENQRKKFGYMIIAGVAFGISSSFKSFSIVIITAYIITEIFALGKKKDWLEIVANALILLGSFFLVKRIILFAVSQWIGTDLSQYSDGVLYHQLLVGLNTEGEGQIHLGTLSRGFWNTFFSNGNNTAAASDYAKRILIEDWSLHKSEIPLLLGKKIVWAWQDDLIPIQYFQTQMGSDGNIHHRIYVMIKDVAPMISQVMYVILCVCGVITVVDDLKHNDSNKAWIFIKMIILGYFFLLLIIEAQSRYKCLIIPLMCMLSASSIVQYFKVE